MGTDIHTYIIKKVANGWKDICLYRKTKTEEEFEVISPYDQRNYQLFSILKESNSTSALDIGDMNDYPNRIIDDIKYAVDWGFSFSEINLADLKYEYIKHPPTDDETEDEDTAPAEVLKNFIDCIEQYIYLAEDFPECKTHPSFYKIIYWFDS